MPTGDVEEDRKQRSPFELLRQVSPESRGLHEAPVSADQPCSLGDKTNKMHRQEVGLIDDFVQLARFRLVKFWPVEEVNHFGDDRPCEISGRRQLQAAGLCRVMQQNKSVVRDGGRVEFVGGQIVREAESHVRRRRL